MDPLSLTASILTIVGATTATLKGLNRVVGLKDAQAEGKKLLAKVQDLRLLLKLLNDTTTGPSASAALLAQDLAPFLSSMEQLTQEFESLVCGTLFRHPGPSANARGKFSRCAWLLEKSKVERLESRLQDMRQNVMCSLSSLMVARMSDVNVISNQVEALRAKTAADYSAFNEKQDNFLQAITGLRLDMGNLVTFASRSSSHSGCHSTAAGTHSLPSTTPAPVTPSHVEPPTPWSSTVRSQSMAKRLNSIWTGPCPEWCRCKCHTIFRAATPQLFKAMFGVLFCGLEGMSFSNRCDYKKCQSNGRWAARLYYYFPRWLVRTGLNLSGIGSWKTIFGDSFAVSMPRPVPGESPIFKHIHLGDVEAVRDMFEKRTASPFDTFENGVSVLHYALWSKKMDVCSLLIGCGADRDLVDGTGRSTSDQAFDIVLRRPDGVLAQTLSTLFLSQGYSDNRAFTPLHKIASGIATHDLAAYLALTDADLDAPDTMGYTPLAYAAWKGNPTHVDLFLRHGADPTIPDKLDRTPLHLAAESGDTRCVELLLHAGAHVDARSYAGHTPLFEAASMGYAHMVAVLVDRGGADLHVADPEGRQALHFATSCGQGDAVEALLGAGADVNARRRNGGTPLREALWLGFDDIAITLVRHGGDLEAARTFEACLNHAGDDCTCWQLVRRVIEEVNSDEIGEHDDQQELFYDTVEMLVEN
ncbi:Fc.00g009560.m01.CDS01 [Cosmosporella sp. VM-42]